MKIDEALKRLQNIKIDEDKRREISEYLAQTFGDKDIRPVYHFMMKDKTIYDFDSYENLLESNKVSPDDAFVYVENDRFTGYYPASYFYPFLIDRYLLPYAYLSKLGLKADLYRVVPATGLRYVVVVYHFPDIDRIVVEVADVGNVVINTNLQTLIHGVLSTKHGTKHITYDEVKEIASRFSSRKLFAGYDFYDAGAIIRGYYESHDTSLAKEVKAIRNAYNCIFQPSRVVYHLKTKRPISSSK